MCQSSLSLYSNMSMRFCQCNHLGELAPSSLKALNLSGAEVGDTHARDLARIACLGSRNPLTRSKIKERYGKCSHTSRANHPYQMLSLAGQAKEMHSLTHRQTDTNTHAHVRTYTRTHTHTPRAWPSTSPPLSHQSGCA